MLLNLPSLLVCVCILPLAGVLKHGNSAHANGLDDKLNTATDFLLDAKMQVEQRDDLTKEVDALTEDVGAGEDKARLDSSQPWNFVSNSRNMFLRNALARPIELSSQCVHCRLLHVLLRLFSCRAGRTPNGFLQSERALVIVMLAFLRAAGNRKPLTQCTALPYSRDVQCHSHAANLCRQGGGCQCACTSSVLFSARYARRCVRLVLCECILPLVLCPGKLHFASLSHGWHYHLHDVAQVSGLGAQTMALIVCCCFHLLRAPKGCNWAV